MDTKTKDFLKKIDYLIERGLVKNTQEVIDTLNWNKSVMSSVRNDKLQVPQHIYNKFKEVYAAELSGGTNDSAAGNEDYKDKALSLLEKQVSMLEKMLAEKDKTIAERDARITLLLQKLDSEFQVLKQASLICTAYTQAHFQATMIHRHRTEDVELPKVKAEMGKMYVAAMDEMMKQSV